MNAGRQAAFGLLMAVLSAVLVMGSFMLSTAESGYQLALAPTVTYTSTWTVVPVTLAPGQPTFTPTPYLSPTPTFTLFVPTSTGCPPPLGWVSYVVQPGETLSEIASRHQISAETLAEKNCLFTQTVYPSMYLWVPPLPTQTPGLTPSPTLVHQPTACVVRPPAGWVQYQVRPGQTLYSISLMFGTTVETLKNVNCIVDPTNITAWSLIWVPNAPTWTPTSVATLRPTSTPTLLLPSATVRPSATLPSTSSSTPVIFPTPSPTSTPVPTNNSTPTNTLIPTDTLAPTSTLQPTGTATTPYPPPLVNPFQGTSNGEISP